MPTVSQFILNSVIAYNKVKSLLGFRVKGGEVIEAGEAYQVREGPVSYNAPFGAKKEDIGPENTYFWNVNL